MPQYSRNYQKKVKENEEPGGLSVSDERVAAFVKINYEFFHSLQTVLNSERKSGPKCTTLGQRGWEIKGFIGEHTWEADWGLYK